jgi:hypothetical protein
MWVSKISRKQDAQVIEAPTNLLETLDAQLQRLQLQLLTLSCVVKQGASAVQILAKLLHFHERLNVVFLLAPGVVPAFIPRPEHVVGIHVSGGCCWPKPTE